MMKKYNLNDKRRIRKFLAIWNDIQYFQGDLQFIRLPTCKTFPYICINKEKREKIT